MKKSLLVAVILIGAINRSFPQEVGDPLTDPRAIDYSNRSTIGKLSNFNLRTIVYNGNIDLLNSLLVFGHLDVIALGTLDDNELKLLRNSIYAKYNYRFRSTDLSDHFGKFQWYKPQYDNVDARLTDLEKSVVDQIKFYEGARAAMNGGKISLVGRWEEFNGGADQTASSIDIKSDGSFIFAYGDNFSREILTIDGQWKYGGILLDLKVDQLTIRLGGYYVLNPSGYDVADSQKYTLTVDGLLEAKIPVSPVTTPKNYPEGVWLSIGGVNMRQLPR